MTMLVVWCEIDAIDRATGATITVRATSHNDPRSTAVGGLAWVPAILRRPGFTMEMFDGAFSGALSPGAGEMDLAFEGVIRSSALYWSRTPCRIWVGAPGTDVTAIAPLFAGVVETAEVRDGRLTLRLGVDDAWLDRPLLGQSYAGTGGAEGGAELTGQPKPLAIGAPRGCEPVLIDPARSIFQYDAYGLVAGVAAAFERAAAFPPAVADYPDYVALAAALDAGDVPPGTLATASASGLVGFGAPPAGVVTLDLLPRTGMRTPGEVIKQLALVAGATSAQIDDASLANLDAELAALDATASWTISHYQRQQVTARTVIQEIAQSCNAAAGVGWHGRLVTPRVRLASPTITLAADGTARPAVTRVEQLEVGAPFWRMALGAERNYRVHRLDEIAFSVQLVDRGDFDTATTYREGEIVRAPDGQRYLYSNPTPTSGNAPPDAAFWTLFEGGARYADGTPIEALKPAEPGATKGAVVDDGSGVGNVTLPSGETVRDTMLLTGAITVSQLPATGAHDGQVVILDDPADPPPRLMQWDAGANNGAGAWVSRGPAKLADLDQQAADKLGGIEAGATATGDANLYSVETDGVVSSRVITSGFPGCRFGQVDGQVGGLTSPARIDLDEADVAVGDPVTVSLEVTSDLPAGNELAVVMIWTDAAGNTVRFHADSARYATPIDVWTRVSATDARPAGARYLHVGVDRVTGTDLATISLRWGMAARGAQARPYVRPTIEATRGATAGSDLRDSGGIVLGDGDIITLLGISAGIVGQGPLATRGDVDVSAGHVTDGGVVLDPDLLRNDAIYVGGDGRLHRGSPTGPTMSGQVDALLIPNGPEEAAANKTELRIALGIAGQGSGATANTLADLDAAAASKLGGIEDGADATAPRLGGGLLVNGGFEAGTTEGWSPVLGAQLSIVAGLHPGSASACRYSVAGTGTGWRLVQWVPVTGGERYMLASIVSRDEASLPNDDLVAGVTFYDSAMTSVGGPETTVSQATAGLQIARLVAQAPASAVRAAVRFRAPARGADGAGHWVVDTVTFDPLPRDANDVPYPDGTPIAALQPAEAGADPTGSHISAGIVGQGPLATRGDVDVSAGHVTDGGVVLDPDLLRNDAIYVGGDGRLHRGSPTGPTMSGQVDALLIPNGPEEAAANKTELRIALGIAGQGSGATANTLADLDAAAASKLGGIQDGADVTADSGLVLLANPRFVRGLDGWVVDSGNVTTLSAGGPDGGPCMRASLGAGAAPAAWAGVHNVIEVPVEAGDRLHVIAYIRGPAGAQATGRWQVRWLDAAGGTVSPTYIGPLVSGTGAWTAMRRLTPAAPPGAQRARLELIAANTSGTPLTQVEDWDFAATAMAMMPRDADIDALKTTNAPAEAGATKGADWATNLTGRPIELTDGRVPSAIASDGRLANARRVRGVQAAGLGASFSARPIAGWTDTGSAARIDLQAVTLQVGGAQVGYPAGSVGGLAYDTTYHIYRDDPALDGGGTYLATTSLQTATAGEDRVYFGSYTTGSAGGSGGGTPPPPDQCIAADQWLPGGLRGHHLRPGHELVVLTEDLAGIERARVMRAEEALAECVEIVTTSGARLVCSMTTPLTLRDGRVVRVPQGMGEQVPVIRRRVGDTGWHLTWEAIIELRPVGPRPVIHVYAGGRTFAAAADPAAGYILTHNGVAKP